MSTVWMVRTQGNPLEAIRALLMKIWQQAGLDGMLVPAHNDRESISSPLLLQDPAQLVGADPCVPLVPVNAARLVAQLARNQPRGRYAAVLRSCESRALTEIRQLEAIDLENWLLIGIDCLASFQRRILSGVCTGPARWITSLKRTWSMRARESSPLTATALPARCACTPKPRNPTW